MYIYAHLYIYIYTYIYKYICICIYTCVKNVSKYVHIYQLYNSFWYKPTTDVRRAPRFHHGKVSTRVCTIFRTAKCIEKVARGNTGPAAAKNLTPFLSLSLSLSLALACTLSQGEADRARRRPRVVYHRVYFSIRG